MSGGRVATVRRLGLQAPAGVAPAGSLRVCHLIGDLDYGGAERQVVNLLGELEVADKYLVLLDPDAGGGLLPTLDPGVRVERCPVRLRSLPLGVLRLASLLRQLRVDVLHSHMFWPNLIGTLAARLAGVPVVVAAEHGKNLWKRRWHRWLERRVISELAALRICASDDIRRLRQEADGVPGNKLLYLPNGTPVPDCPPRPLNSPPVIGSVGRLVAAKDYPTLIAAAARLQRRGVAFRLCLVGDGPERDRLERLIADHRLEGVVRLTGFQEDIGAWLRGFDLFVLPSIREGQPLALLEAMAHGLPVVATRVGGIPATVAEGREALLVPPGDPAALADALGELVQDAPLRRRLAEHARARVERDFSIAASAARHLELYHRLWEQSDAAAA